MTTDLAPYERALQAQAPAFAQVLPPGLPVQRLMRTVLVSLERTPALLQCSQQSILNAAMSAAVLGLEVDGTTGQAFLIPFKGRAQLVVGYRGYNTIGARGGITISGNVVREGDPFDYQLGSDAYAHHKPLLGSKAPIIGAWAVAAAEDRPPIVEVLGIDDIEAIRKRSPGARKADSPWNDPDIGFPAMAAKTAKRRLSRSLPLLPYQRAAAMEDAVERGRPAHIEPDGQVVIEGEASPLPERDTLHRPDDIIDEYAVHPAIAALPPRAREAAQTALRVIAQAQDGQEVMAAIDRFRQAREYLRREQPDASSVVERAFNAAYREHVDPQHQPKQDGA